jgi:hypothetical protein
MSPVETLFAAAAIVVFLIIVLMTVAEFRKMALEIPTAR